MSFRSFLQRCLGKLFKLRQVSTSSPVAWATSNSLSRDKPPPEACKYCMVNGDDTRWPRPPSEVEVIFDFYFFGTLTLWRHHFFHLDEKADICFDGKWKIWGRAVRLQPGRGGFSRTTKYQLFEQVDRWLARVGKGTTGRCRRRRRWRRCCTVAANVKNPPKHKFTQSKDVFKTCMGR